MPKTNFSDCYISTVSKTPKGVGDGSNAKEFTAVPFKDATAKASDPRILPTVESEFIRMGDLRRLFGITRATAYLLAKDGKIKTLSMRQKGNVRGVRLVSVPSVRAYLHGLMDRES